MRRPRRTLRGRLALMALITGAVWVAVLTAVFNLALDKRLHEQADDVLRTRAEAVATTVEARTDGRLVVHEPAQDQALDSGVWIYQGRRIKERPPGAPAALQRRADQLAGRHEVFTDVSVGADGGPGATRLYALPVPAASGSGQAGTVVASVSLDPYRSTADTALAGSLTLAVLLLATVYLLTRLVVRRALRPVAEMSDQATRWSEAGAPERFGAAGRPAELAAFATSLDALLDRLAAVLRHEQHQAAALSHELRTPLARIIAETEWLARRPRTAAEQDLSHGTIARSAATMRQICDVLLSEARTRGTLTPGSCRFPALAEELARRLAADHPGAPAVAVTGDPVTVGVPAAVAEQILRPLLENARRYATHTVTLHCTADADRVTLYVGDDGPGVPEEFRGALFEPGRRADPGDGHDGAGLGLALARRLARAAGGDLMLAAAGPGARFAVTLPAG
ncbi:HAMP domain-containing histidine kinase [Streptomyces sp. TM32]|uniref:ATP-binding protein n=1 Tax=Streptomyces sp. TM32 TaxID=1652669 RepID=UPI0010107FED|nr:HAMP domain-containing sensor histidine kinase [Streptomyces sp. TM32]RXS70272.1 HAMP domain-containing histidine kinase [Streptomyces sp. TM32]